MADEFLGGSGVFLTGYSELCSRGTPAAAVSTTRIEDLVTVARLFAEVRTPGTTPASFATECENAYRETFPERGGVESAEDSLALTNIGECLRRFRESTFLIVGRGRPGQEHHVAPHHRGAEPYRGFP